MGRATPPRSTNGWRSGQDPIQRWLRILTALVCLGVFVYLAVAGMGGADRVVVIALALGAVLVLLGYEGILKLPIIGAELQRPSDPTQEEDIQP